MRKDKNKNAGTGNANGSKAGSKSGRRVSVAIIGSGFAGMSAALLLGRYLVDTIVFDGGRTRNSATKHIHGYLGLENISPKKFIEMARHDVSQYRSVRFARARIVRVKNHGEFFSATTADGRTFRSRYVIIATGVKDHKPDIEGFSRFEGNGAWHCPHCDGFESKGKRLAIIASMSGSISYAKEFLGWTRDITVIDVGGHLPPDQKKEAESLGIRTIENDSPVRITGRRGRPSAIICKSGLKCNADVIFYHLGYEIQNNIARQLGCELDKDGYVKVDKGQQTTIQRVHAVGDIDTDRHYVALACASGALAAISIYEDMLKEKIKVLKSNS